MLELKKEQSAKLRAENMERLKAFKASPPPPPTPKPQKDYKARPLAVPIFEPVRMTSLKPPPNSASLV